MSGNRNKRPSSHLPPTEGPEENGRADTHQDHFTADYHYEGAPPRRSRWLNPITGLIGAAAIVGGIVYHAGVLSASKADKEAVTEEIKSKVSTHADDEHPKTEEKLEKIQEHLHSVEVKQTAIDVKMENIQKSVESIDEKLSPRRGRRRPARRSAGERGDP